MKPKATQINGITDAMIHAADVPFFNTVHQKLTQLLEGSVIVAHTSHFDERLIRQSCGELPPPAQPWLCSCKLSRRLLPELVSHKLADVCGHYGITINSAHRAGGDVAALASVLPHLLRDAKSRGIQTWEQLQQFMQNRRTAPIAGGGAAAISRPGGSSSSVRGSGNSDSQNNNNGSGGSRNSPLNPPAPFDASAPRGTHPWDSAARKRNGSMNGPWTKDGRPDMRRRENFA
jgi:DNA polymerase III epsilon subunit-like protein